MLTAMMPEATNDLPALPGLRLGRYRHYKGGEYEVIGIARHSETHEPQVVYRPLYMRCSWRTWSSTACGSRASLSSKAAEQRSRPTLRGTARPQDLPNQER
ncbi:MAG: hypothetical protein K0S57_4014 [Ramlibacter sp.]|nr:hypothetical protein [Ramlibacter sp.]